MSERELVGIPEIARTLGIDEVRARRLSRSGLLGTTYRVGRQIVAEREALDELASRPFVEAPHPGATVIRLDVARSLKKGEDTAWPKRKVVGFHTDLKGQELLDAIRGWWRIGPGLEGTLVVYTLSDFVVGVYKIKDYDGQVGPVRRLELESPAPSDGYEAFVERRLYTGQGGNTVNLPAAEA